MGKKSKPNEGKILNKKARFDYELGDDLVVGIQLTGAETKALRRGHGQLRGAFVTVKDGELWLLNATITGDSSIKINDIDKTRSRKILAKRREIDHLLRLKDQGRTIVPLAILTQGRYVKLRISAGKGKKNYDKRETIKRRDINRQNETELSKHI